MYLDQSNFAKLLCLDGLCNFPHILRHFDARPQIENDEYEFKYSPI